MGGGKGAGEGCVPQTQDQCRGRASVARGQRRTEPGARSRGRTAVPSRGSCPDPTSRRGVGAWSGSVRPEALAVPIETGPA